jgi:translation initiation factor 1 (eIF-1/SUI1)
MVSAGWWVYWWPVCPLQVIQLQGDQRKNVATFLVQVFRNWAD